MWQQHRAGNTSGDTSSQTTSTSFDIRRGWCGRYTHHPVSDSDRRIRHHPNWQW